MRNRKTYSDLAEVKPSEQALLILENVVSNYSLDRLMIMANCGSHTLNPYHNTVHELQNVYYSFSCFSNEPGSFSGPGLQELAQASLFHDHNHSGGILLDHANIARAVDFADNELNFSEPTLNIIRCTQFTDGKFPVEPTNLAERSIRDADLMTIYSHEGFHLTLGLFEEMARKPVEKFTEEELRTAIARTESFLSAQTMFTEHGKRMQGEHLKDQLRKFEEYVWRRFHYLTYLRKESEGEVKVD